MADVIVNATLSGSIHLVKPVTDEAKTWVEENVVLEGWQWLGRHFAVDYRYIEALVDGMRADGLEVEVTS